MGIDLSRYDVVDFGCSNGLSLQFAFDNLGCESGIGIDIDPRKVAAARERGFEAEVADLTGAEAFEGRARIAVMSHFLEHVPSAAMAAQIIATAAKVTSEYFLIRQPWFDCDGPLAAMGLKLYWSDWRGHSNHMTSLQLYLALRRLRLAGEIASFSIFGHLPVAHSSHEVIVPLTRPGEGQKYDAEKDAPKPQQDLGFACYREIVALAGVSPAVDTKVLPKPFRDYHLLFHEAAGEAA